MPSALGDTRGGRRLGRLTPTANSVPCLRHSDKAEPAVRTPFPPAGAPPLAAMVGAAVPAALGDTKGRAPARQAQGRLRAGPAAGSGRAGRPRSRDHGQRRPVTSNKYLIYLLTFHAERDKVSSVFRYLCDYTPSARFPTGASSFICPLTTDARRASACPPCPRAEAALAAPKTRLSTLDTILSIRAVFGGPFGPPYGRHRRRLWGPGQTVGIAVSPAATGLRPLSRDRLRYPGSSSASSRVRPSGPRNAFFLDRHFTPIFRPPKDKNMSIAESGLRD